jgi:SET family sugar efflux transporter-like MFS transporter
VLACVLFAWNRNYFILLFIGVFLSSFGSPPTRRCLPSPASMPTKPAAKRSCSAPFCAQVSLAWVIGPPLAYALAMGFGFTVMYLSAAVAFVVCGAMVWFFFPACVKSRRLLRAILKRRAPTAATLLLFSICTLMWGINSLYIINMPLFIIELHLPEKLAGIMMGTAAGLEIPTMLIAGYYAKRFGKRF